MSENDYTVLPRLTAPRLTELRLSEPKIEAKKTAQVLIDFQPKSGEKIFCGKIRQAFVKV